MEENTATVTMLVGLRERGLDTSRSIFVVSTAATVAAVMRVFDHPVIGRCQIHKLRNVADKLPVHLAATLTKRMRATCQAETTVAAEAQLRSARPRARPHPSRRCGKAWPRRYI